MLLIAFLSFAAARFIVNWRESCSVVLPHRIPSPTELLRHPLPRHPPRPEVAAPPLTRSFTCFLPPDREPEDTDVAFDDIERPQRLILPLGHFTYKIDIGQDVWQIHGNLTSPTSMFHLGHFANRTLSPFLVEHYDNGNYCASMKRRSTTIEYECPATTAATPGLLKFAESDCTYTIRIYLPSVCKHPAFSKEPPDTVITCCKRASYDVVVSQS